MSYSSKMSAEFVHYLESVVNLDALDRMIKDLDDELKDSQKVMNEVKTMIDSLPKRCEEPAPTGDNVVKHEGISSILARSPPNLLLPDMVQHTDTVDIDSVIATMKSYTEDMRKKFAVPDVEVPVPGRSTRVEGKFEDLNLEQYANSLDVLCKRLSNLKLNKKVETDRNMELETKLAILFDDVNMFTQMVHARTKLSEVNKNWTPSQNSTEALKYDNLINKLLSSINEVLYLLQSKQ